MAFDHLSCAQLQEWFSDQKTVQLVDIRDLQSFQQGHIDGAVHIHNDNVEDFIQRADHNQPIVVCCYHGNSSQGAADFFNQRGFTSAYSLAGGYEAWKTQSK